MTEAPMPVGRTSPVSVVMAAPVVTIEPTATLRQAASQLADEDVAAIVVLRPDGLGGLLTERDIVRALAAGAQPDAASVDGAMVDRPWSVDADTPIEAVADLMLRAGIRHVPVVTGRDVLGMVSIRDVLAVFSDPIRHERD